MSLIVTVTIASIRWARYYGKPRAILIYNPYLGYALPSLLLSRIWGIPAIIIVADLSPAPQWSWRNVLRNIEARLQRWATTRFTALLPFSIHVVHDLNFKGPFLRLSPGIEGRDFEALELLKEDQHERALLFSGTLNTANGLQFLLDAFERVTDQTIQLWITGHGEMEPQVEMAARSNKRIRFYGFLLREDLLRLSRRSLVLVNPRPAFLAEHRYNFPSKIIEYLATGRPVISTATADVAQEYGDFLYLLKEETPQAFARLIDSTFNKTDAELNEAGKRGQRFVMEENNWAVLGNRVRRFLSKIINGGVS